MLPPGPWLVLKQGRVWGARWIDNAISCSFPLLAGYGELLAYL